MTREMHFAHGKNTVAVRVEPDGDGWRVTVNGRSRRVAAQRGERGRFVLDMEGRRATLHVARQGARIQVHDGGEVWALERARGAQSARAAEAPAAGLLTAAMPGRVLDVLVAPGDSVRKGETLLLLEAMKMELRIAAPADGSVAQVFVQPGQVIERAAPLIELRNEQP